MPAAGAFCSNIRSYSGVLHPWAYMDEAVKRLSTPGPMYVANSLIAPRMSTKDAPHGTTTRPFSISMDSSRRQHFVIVAVPDDAARSLGQKDTIGGRSP